MFGLGKKSSETTKEVPKVNVPQKEQKPNGTLDTPNSPKKSGFMDKMRSAKDQLASKISDSMHETPAIDTIATENRANIQGNVTTDCKVFVSCEVGKKIKYALSSQLSSAANEFVKSLEGLKSPSQEVGELQGFAQKVKDKVTEIKNAETAYNNKIASIIKLDPALPCRVAVQKTVNSEGNKIIKVDGLITELNPKNGKFKVEATALKKISTGTKEIKIVENPDIENICVGGSTADDNFAQNCFKQQGGNHRGGSSKTEILPVSSDLGICE